MIKRYGFRGRCAHRQYIPSTPDPYGIKYWNICDCKTAYLCDSIPYLGRSEENSKNETEIGRKMVEALSSRFNGSGRVIGISFIINFIFLKI